MDREFSSLGSSCGCYATPGPKFYHVRGHAWYMPTSTTASLSYYPVPSSSSTVKFKRHYLARLPPASPRPQPLHLLDGSITSSSSASTSSLSPSTSAKASRRQSSTSYYPPGRTPDYYAASSTNLNNAARSPLSARGAQPSAHAGAGLSRSS